MRRDLPALRDNYPHLVRRNREVTLNEPVSGVIGLTSLLTSFFTSLGVGGTGLTATVAATGATYAVGSGAAAALAATVGGYMVTTAIGMGLSLLSSLLASSPSQSNRSSITGGGLSLHARYGSGVDQVLL